MAESLMILCLVLAGPIAISATEAATDGDFIDLPQGDFDQLSRWGIVREATEAEKSAREIPPTPLEKGEPEIEPEEAPRETAAEKKKREKLEAAEAKAAQEAEELAALEAAANLETEPAA